VKIHPHYFINGVIARHVEIELGYSDADMTMRPQLTAANLTEPALSYHAVYGGGSTEAALAARAIEGVT
jgi:uncharacterized protein YaiL (DUF2058 family)